jgi:DNA-binding transcriptional LysR family regulator
MVDLNTLGDLWPRGLLRITASVTFGQMCIMPLLGDFRAPYPHLKVECLFTDANLDLVADRIDLAVRLAPIVRGDLIVSKLMDTRWVANKAARLERIRAAKAFLEAEAKQPPRQETIRVGPLRTRTCRAF